MWRWRQKPSESRDVTTFSGIKVLRMTNHAVHAMLMSLFREECVCVYHAGSLGNDIQQ